MVDYHLHTKRCCHATGSMEEYVQEAKNKGFSEIGFADHFPLELLHYNPRVPVSMKPEELDSYIEDVLSLRKLNDGMKIRLGIEVDYIPGIEKRIETLLARYPFDYVIGSLHFMDGWDFTHPVYADDYKDKDLEELYERFFQLTAQLTESGLFDIIGHVDVIKKFGYRPEGKLDDLWLRAAREFKKGDICIELNTAGRDAPVGDFYPDQRFLEICCDQGVPVTMGSDAHAPEQVGRYIQEGIEALKAAGYRELSVFEMRKRRSVLL